MSAKGSAANLLQATKNLFAEWEKTKAYWQDAKCAEFEKDYLGDLPEYVNRTINSLQDLDKVLGKVKTDCE